LLVVVIVVVVFIVVVLVVVVIFVVVVAITDVIRLDADSDLRHLTEEGHPLQKHATNTGTLSSKEPSTWKWVDNINSRGSNSRTSSSISSSLYYNNV